MRVSCAHVWWPMGAVWLRRLALALVLAVATAALLPWSPASAHATLLFTSPAVDGAVPDSPPLVQLVFDQPVVAGQTSLSVRSAGGESTRLGPVETGADASVVRARVLEELEHVHHIARAGRAHIANPTTLDNYLIG